MKNKIIIFILVAFCISAAFYICSITTEDNIKIVVDSEENNFKENLDRKGFFNYITMVMIKNNSKKVQDIKAENGILLHKKDINKNNKLYYILSTDILGSHSITINYKIKNIKKFNKVKIYDLYSHRYNNIKKVKSDKNIEYINNYNSLNIGRLNKDRTEYDNFMLYSNSDLNLDKVDSFVGKNFDRYYDTNKNLQKPIVIGIDKNSTIRSEFRNLNYNLSGVYSDNIIIVKENSKFESVLVHELSHYYNDFVFDKYPETWIDEGIAEYISRTYSGMSLYNISDYETCLRSKCYYHKDINESNLNKMYSKRDDPTNVWESKKIDNLAYEYSFLVVAKQLEKQDRNLGKEIIMINNGTNPKEIFDIKPCEDKDYIECTKR